MQRYYYRHVKVVLLCLFLTLTATLWADVASQVKIYHTRQPAQNLMKVIEPLYGDMAKISAIDYRLIVKGTPAVIQDIQELLIELDSQPKNLLIEVASGIAHTDSYTDYGINSKIKVNGNTTISNDFPDQHNPGVTIRYKNNGSVIKATSSHERNIHNGTGDYSIRTLEGQWATIKAGQMVPYFSPQQLNRNTPGNHRVEYADVTSGFEVLATTSGQQVTLKVRPRQYGLENGGFKNRRAKSINSLMLDTVVTGKIGDWIELGNMAEKIQNNSQGIISGSQSQNNNEGNFSVRITIIE